MFPAAARGNQEGLEDQSQIEKETRALQVQAIESKLGSAGDVARRVDLRESGEAGTNAMAFTITGNRFERYQPAVAADFDFAGHQWSRADKAHIADENVPELRQFVHRRRMQHPSDARDPWIVLPRLHRSEASIGIGHHRTELERFEHPAAEADSRLRKEHRAAVLELDRGRNDDPQRQRQQQANPGKRRVEQALDHPARRVTRANRSWYALTATRRSNCSAAPRALRPIVRTAAGSS